MLTIIFSLTKDYIIVLWIIIFDYWQNKSDHIMWPHLFV